MEYPSSFSFFQILWIFYALAAFTVAVVYSPLSGLVIFLLIVMLYLVMNACTEMALRINRGTEEEEEETIPIDASEILVEKV